MEEQVKRCEDSIKTNQENIAAEVRRENAGGERQRQQEHLQSLGDIVARLEVEMIDTDDKIAQLDREIKSGDETLRDLRKQKDNAQSAFSQAKTRLGELERSKSSTLSIFHQNMPQVIAAIKQNQNKFSDPPVGPLGLHVKVIKEQWASICETLFGKNLNGFLVTNHHDRTTLRKILIDKRWYLSVNG
jgi:chromosome segregation ATPase